MYEIEGEVYPGGVARTSIVLSERGHTDEGRAEMTSLRFSSLLKIKTSLEKGIHWMLTRL